ncbi:putative adenosine deaminase [Aspergillus undulatus]|uniref:putative adenosine deaminase n=1 Tax=Aspergillus undulatus TaxID=1810928 RepID=UPI003CCE4DD9
MGLSKPVDSQFTRSLPKIELHAHLSGSISRQCLHEIWFQKKARDPAFDVEDPWVVMPPGKVDFSLNTFFNTFNQSIYHLVRDLDTIAFATNSVLEDFLSDGVRYLELRTIPRAAPGSSFTRDQYLSTVLDTIDAFRSQNNDRMSIYLILGMDRGQLVHDSTHANEIVDLAIANRARGVVGVDVCGNPTKGDIALCRDAFAKAKEHGLGLTVHFAEIHSAELRAELETMLSFNPDRLGHVIHVPEDIKQEIARRRLGLELCISCNVHAKMFDGGFLDHHFGYWRHEDCPIALCTDDVGFFCSPVSTEYLLAAEHFQLDRSEIIKILRRAVDSIFSGDREKERLRRLLDEFQLSSSQ